MAVDVKTVRDAENSVRDLRNWLAVFKTEYDVSEEAYKVLHAKIEELGAKIGSIKCIAPGKVDANSVKPASNTLRDAKAWLATFAKEYDLPAEAVKVLHENFDKVGQKIAAIECR
jgi:hypothetical protein